MARIAASAVVRDSEFRIGLAVEDEPGYYPMGFGPFQTYDDAARFADALNASRGLSPKDAMMIVASSMRAGKVKKGGQ